MDTFVKRFQPERYNDWINGTDYGPHPEDPTTTVAAAPMPSDKDVLLNKNNSVSDRIIETLKKKCNPTMKKSFKERNPDVDMDEIQNNPNVPDDVKAAISGALTLTPEDELEESEGNEEEPALIPTNGKNFLDVYDNDLLFDMSDDELSYRKSRRKRNHDIDEEWCASGNSRKNNRKKKKKAKDIKREHSDESEKRAKNKTPKKPKKMETTGTVLIDQTIMNNSAIANNTSKMNSPACAVSNSDHNLELYVEFTDKYNDNSIVAIRNENDHSGGEVKLNHTENLVKLEIEELEIPAECLFKGKKVRKRSSVEKEKTPRVKTKTKFSTIDAIVQSIENVVKGVDYVSIEKEEPIDVLNDSKFDQNTIEVIRSDETKYTTEFSHIEINDRSMQPSHTAQGNFVPLRAPAKVVPAKQGERTSTKNKQPKKIISANISNKSAVVSSNATQVSTAPSQMSASVNILDSAKKITAPPLKSKQPKNEGFADVYSKFLQESSIQNNYTPKKNPLSIIAKSQNNRNQINSGVPLISESVNSHTTTFVETTAAQSDNENVGQGQTVKLSIEPTTRPAKSTANAKKVLAKKLTAKKIPEKSIEVYECISTDQWNQMQRTSNNGAALQQSFVYVRKEPAIAGELPAPVAVVAPLPTAASQSSQKILYNYSVAPLTSNTKTIPINSSQSILADNRPQIAIEAPVRAVNLKAFKNTKLVSTPSMKKIQMPTNNLEQFTSLPISIPIYTANATNEIIPNGNAKHTAATVCLNNTSGSVVETSATTICYIQQNAKNSNCIKTK